MFNDTIETIQGARAMLKRANTLNDVKYFTTMVSKAFRKPSLQAAFGAELAPIHNVQENLQGVKKAEMTLEDYRHWFDNLKTSLITSLSTLEDAVSNLGEEQFITIASTKSAGASRTPAVKYVTMGGDKVLTSVAINSVVEQLSLNDIINGVHLTDAVATACNAVEIADAEDQTVILRAIGTAFKKAEKGIRYRNERADKGEPKPKSK